MVIVVIQVMEEDLVPVLMDMVVLTQDLMDQIQDRLTAVMVAIKISK